MLLSCHGAGALHHARGKAVIASAARDVAVMNSQIPEQRGNRPVVLTSLEDAEGFRCVDIFLRLDGTFGFKEFRRDPEDAGHWTLVSDFSRLVYLTKGDALKAASEKVSWFAAIHKT